MGARNRKEDGPLRPSPVDCTLSLFGASGDRPRAGRSPEAPNRERVQSTGLGRSGPSSFRFRAPIENPSPTLSGLNVSEPGGETGTKSPPVLARTAALAH